MPGTITEPAREIPIVRDVDVVVAGAGVCGVPAALAAAKCGASVLLVDRFGALGGNMGTPALTMFGGTGLVERDAVGYIGGDYSNFVTSIMLELAARTRQTLGCSRTYPEVSHAYSYAAVRMAEELGVELMLSAYVSDPIMAGHNVIGLYVETKIGRVAVTGKVVVDATGDASIASRAGAPVISRQPAEDMDYPSVGKHLRNPKYAYWNDGALMYIVTGVDMTLYNWWRWDTMDKEWGPGDGDWYHAHFEEEWSKGQKALAPALRKADESGEFTMDRDIRPKLHTKFSPTFAELRPGTYTSVCAVEGEFDTGNWEDISLIETRVRTHILDGICFLRNNIPGFAGVALIGEAAFLGARGGPHIHGEYLLTVKDGFEGLRHPDTMFMSHAEVHRGAEEPGHDAPYGMIVPQKIDGLLVTARGASWVRRGHDPSFRCRTQMICFGQAAGMAAAMACSDNVKPRDLDVKKLQKALLKEGFYLGDEKRLAKLGLTEEG